MWWQVLVLHLLLSDERCLDDSAERSLAVSLMTGEGSDRPHSGGVRNGPDLGDLAHEVHISLHLMSNEDPLLVLGGRVEDGRRLLRGVKG